MTILYITQNGVTDHIGRSQVAPYVLGLAREGFRIHVLSAEKPDRDVLIAQYQRLFDQARVRWTRAPYHNQPPLLGQAWTQLKMLHAARRIVREDSIRLVHCRNHLPAMIGYHLKRGSGVKYVFDFRDFTPDGGLRKTRGPTRLAHRGMKEMEGPMIRHADKIVCLTKRASHLLANWYLNHDAAAANRFQVIPCCADFAHFDVERVSPADSDAARARAGLKSDDFVLLYLGSLGPDYLLPQMMALFREVLAVKPQAVFLFLSNNGQELVEAECAKQNIPIEQIRFLSSDRNEIPAYIGLASLSVFFIRNDYDKIGCSPTKLAELFACNVPVIANSGVGDLDDILDLGRNNSIVINDFAEPSLREAVNRVISIRRVGRVNIRQNSYEFALDEGVARYAAIYRELGA